MWFHDLVIKPAPKIIGVGKNYLKHAIEMGGSEVPKEPLIFLKPWSSLVFAPKQVNLSRTGRKNEIHHELELGVVIGKKGYNIPKDKVKEYICGYVLALDLTDRGKYPSIQTSNPQPKRPPSRGTFPKVRTTSAPSAK